MTLPDGLKLVPGPAQTVLNEQQQMDDANHREDLLNWLATLGKQPDKERGYRQALVRNTTYCLDQIYRWVWDKDRDTTEITHDHADAYVRALAGRDISNASKAKYVMSLKRLFKWKHNVRGGELWDSEISFSTDKGASNPRDYFTTTEHVSVREAAAFAGWIQDRPIDNRWVGSGPAAEYRAGVQQDLFERFYQRLTD